MKSKLINNITQYVKDNIGAFHENRISKLETLKLKDVLKRKNPYLFKAKYLMTAADIVKCLVDAFISSSEETIFGNWLEGLAIFVNQEVFNGRKSSASGIDLEFDRNNIRYIVSIKSGPNWGNSRQIKKMRNDFLTAKKILRTSTTKKALRAGSTQLEIVAVNGCCYGKESASDKGDYFKYCGQDFWYFISGEKNLYIDIIEPLATKAKEKNEEFQKMYAKILNKFTEKFISDFCEDGNINWKKLVEFNSKSDNLE